MRYPTLIFPRLLLLLGLFSTLSACGSKPQPSTTHHQTAQITVDTVLKSRLKDFAKQRRPKGEFAFYVYDLTADRPLCGYQERQAMSSASCLKLLSGVAGLHLLGTNYHYATTVYTKGKVVNGTLQGDIALEAGLDPQLMATDLDMFAQAIKDKGIKDVSGKCYLRLTLTQPVKSEAHWYPWDLNFSKYGILYKGSDKVIKAWQQALVRAGIRMTSDRFVIGNIPQGAQGVLRFRRPITKVTERMWKHSSNTQATAMLYTIGHHVAPKQDPTTAGVAYLRRFLRDTLGLKDAGLTVHDGCGLCTHNKLSPMALTTILRYAYRRPAIHKLLNEQLSIAGVDGTLSREMSGPKTKNKIHAKTGTLSHPYGISSLAGYCQGSNGHRLAFAIMDTQMSVLDARVLQCKLCELLVSDMTSRKP